MAQTNLNIRMDEDLKSSFNRLCEDLGMSMTTAICVFARKAVAEQRIPFELTANDPFYSPANLERLRRSAAQMERDGGTIHELKEVSDDD